MSDSIVNEHWSKAIKKAIGDEVAKIVDEEAGAASDRVMKRISEHKQAIIERAVDRIKVTQKRSPDACLRFEVVIEL